MPVESVLIAYEIRAGVDRLYASTVVVESSLLSMSQAVLEWVFMFLRKNRKKVDGEFYEYWTLCESTRTERGPRQRVVASLSKLTEEDLRAGWEDIEALRSGENDRLNNQNPSVYKHLVFLTAELGLACAL